MPQVWAIESWDVVRLSRLELNRGGKQVSEDTCRRCGVEMWTEGKIDDDIKLCHPCFLFLYEKKEEEIYAYIVR